MILWESFDKNEIYIFILLVVAYAALFLFPKILPRNITFLFLIWGFTSATLFDFTIGGGLLDFYKVNDSNQYELTDLLTYFLFAPFSYFFVYFYEKFRINKRTFIFYVVAWAVIGLAMEKVSTIMGVTHYLNGYNIQYSLIIFVVIQTTTALYYEFIKKNQ
ncbi:hypothetical protein [Peribacillus alkalitolerans]|uniref:hypothetical protein n=1 Tax=Peribacillus alkalitolerans TaxID=1550385 RepID=UPI0013D69FB7|nr:hypothetical protein [Peribacillus alkalitolerans]